MANRFKFIGQDSSTALGADLVINQNGIKDPNFVVEGVHIRHEILLSAVSSGDFDETNVGAANHEWLWRKTNRPFLNNISAAAMDLWAKAQAAPDNGGYNVLIDQAAATTLHVFDFYLPLKRQQAARPDDYSVSLDEFGTLTVTLPSALTNITGGTLTTWTVRAYAVGRDAKPGEYVAGVLTRIDELTGPSGNDVDLKAYGNKIRSLHEFTWASDGSPDSIDGEEGMRIEIDGVQKYDWRNLAGGDLNYYAGPGKGNGQLYSAFYQAGATPQQNTLIAPLIPVDPEAKISDFPQASVISISYTGRIATSTEARFILETLYPDSTGSKLRERVPGAESIDDPNDAAKRPGVSGSAAGAADSAFLPVTVRT